MMYFGVTSLAELGTVLAVVFAAFGTILVGFYKYAQAREDAFEASRMTQALAFEDTITKLSTSLDNNVEAHKQVAETNKEIAKAVNKQALESEKRNGHLGDQNIQIATLVTDQNRDVKAIKDILSKSAVIAAEDRNALLNPIQHIDEQIVDKQVINNKEGL